MASSKVLVSYCLLFVVFNTNFEAQIYGKTEIILKLYFSSI